MYGRFNRTHKPRPHIYPLGPQTQCRRQTLPIRKSATGYKWHLQTLPCSAQEYEIRDIALAHMARTFKSIDGEEIHAQFYSRFCMSDSGAFMQYYYPRFFQLRDDRTGGVTRRFNNPDALGYDNAGVGVVVWWNESGEEREIYGEGRFGHGAAFADFGAEGFGVGLREGCELFGDVSD